MTKIKRVASAVVAGVLLTTGIAAAKDGAGPEQRGQAAAARAAVAKRLVAGVVDAVGASSITLRVRNGTLVSVL